MKNGYGKTRNEIKDPEKKEALKRALKDPEVDIEVTFVNNY